MGDSEHPPGVPTMVKMPAKAPPAPEPVPLPPLFKYLDVRGAKLTLGNNTFKHSKPSDFNDTEDLTIQSIFPEEVEAALKKLENGFTDVVLNHLDDLSTSSSVSAMPRRNAAMRCAEDASESELRNPITGIAACCALAASGHVAIAPPRTVMNWRRCTSSIGRPIAVAVAGMPRTIAGRTPRGPWGKPELF